MNFAKAQGRQAGEKVFIQRKESTHQEDKVAAHRSDLGVLCLWQGREAICCLQVYSRMPAVFTNYIKGHFYFKLVCLGDHGQQTAPYHWVLGGISQYTVSTTSFLFSFTFLKPQQGFVSFHGPASHNWTEAAPITSLSHCHYKLLKETKFSQN